MVRQDSEVAFDWQEASPDPVIPADNFSVRWTKQAWFEGALYTFYATMDDGMRLYVDDELLIDEWHNAWGETYEVDVDLPSDPELKVEYYEDGGGAEIEFSYEKR